MAKVTCELKIEFTSTPGDNLGGWLRTESQSLYEAIKSLGYEWEPRGHDEYYLCEIREPEGSEKIDLVRQSILQAGFLECHTSIIPKHLRRTHFAFSCVRSFSKKDQDQAEYLRLNVKGQARIADWKETKNSGYVLKANSRLKNNLTFGWIDIVIVPYVSQEGRAALEKEGFKGVQFVPAVFDAPEKAMKPLYQLTSSLVMPPCLLPIQNNHGDVVSIDCSQGARIWDDAGYVLPILKYRRKEVELMEPFDIAMTREKVGNLPQHYRHQYIVSQRFRKLLESMKVREVDFIPVELVDGSEESAVGQ